MVSAVSTASALPALALTPAELLGPDLRPQAISLAGFRDGQISFFDSERRLRSEPAEQFVQIRDIGGERVGGAAILTPVLELVDGQRLVGEWLGGDAAGSAVRWRHPLLGEIDVPLEDLRVITRGEAALRAAGGSGASGGSGGGGEAGVDTVVTANGDELRGFVAGIGVQSLTIEPEGVDQPVELPLERVHSVRLANPVSEARRPTPEQHLVVFRDGSRLLGSELEIAGEQLGFQPALAPSDRPGVVIPLGDVARVDLVGAGWELVSLTDRPVRVTDGGEVFGVSMPPRIEGGDLLLHAPVGVDIELPADATRLAATATLDLDEGALATDWADFEVVIPAADPGASDHRYRLHGGEPVQPINIPLDGRLSIRLDAGVNGPILDRLRLRDGVLLLRHGRTESGE